MKKKLTNVAKGKKVTTALDFCKVFGDLDVTKKTGVIANLQKTLDEGKTMSGKIMPDNQKPAVKQLLAWCTVNLLVGNELCAPETITNY